MGKVVEHPIAIIGAGVTGLTAAFYLKRAGVPVTVYEAGGRAGGVIQSIRANGFLAEAGPNTLLETSPKITQLIRDAGLEARKLAPDPRAEARYVVRGGRPVRMPATPPGFFATRLFSWRAKLAVLREPFVPPRRDGVEESIAQFAVRRLNQEFLDRAVDALVAGIYAGDPQKLSLPHAFPRLKAAEDNYGSLIKSQLFGARARKKSGEVSKDRAPKFSFDEGLQVLPDTLAAHLGDALKLNATVTRLMKTASGWRVCWTEGRVSEGRVTRVPNTPARRDELHESPSKSEIRDSCNSSLRAEGATEHSAVIYCGTAWQLAKLEISGNDSSLTTPSEETHRRDACATTAASTAAFAEINYPPVASVVLGFRRADVAHPACGFGMLIPRIENFQILGTIFSSSLFPNRAPEGYLTLTSYLGGARRPELALLPPEKLVATTLANLRVLLGVKGEPVFAHVQTWPKAIPQYNVGFGQYRERLTALEAQLPGLFFAGHYRDGVSLGDSIVSGVNMAAKVKGRMKNEE